MSLTFTKTIPARAISVRLARENDIPLMQIMSILSYNAARHLGDMGLKAMQERGRIQEGMVADIVVFHPEQFTDNSTYTQGSLPATGMKAVLVNGTVVLQDDTVILDRFPCQPIQFDPEDQPRFEPVSVEAWGQSFMTGTRTWKVVNSQSLLRIDQATFRLLKTRFSGGFKTETHCRQPNRGLVT
ncbi:hypothetical protein ACFL1V_10830 [Pseudomonadota bacterium]